MHPLCKIPSQGYVDLHLKTDKIRTVMIVPGGTHFNWAFVVRRAKSDTEI